MLMKWKKIQKVTDEGENEPKGCTEQVSASQFRLETDTVSTKGNVKVGNIENFIGQIVRASS